MPFFSKVFKSRDASKKNLLDGRKSTIPPKPEWTDAWQRRTIEAEEVHELLRGCTQEIKSRGMQLKLGSLCPDSSAATVTFGS